MDALTTSPQLRIYAVTSVGDPHFTFWKTVDANCRLPSDLGQGDSNVRRPADYRLEVLFAIIVPCR